MMPKKPTKKENETILWDADPNCKHDIYSDFYGGGGIKCRKCNGWFCY